MAIDFGLLQNPQQQSRVVANLPQQANSTDSLMGGVMSGMKQASDIQVNNQQIAASKQAMDINAKKAPADLAETQARTGLLGAQTSSVNMDINTKIATAQAAKAQADAFKKSYEDGMQQVWQQHPELAAQITNQMAQTKNQLSQAAEHMATTKTKAGDVYNQMAGAGADLATHAANGKTPEEQNALYQQGLKMMGPDLASSFPQQYTPAVHGVLLGLGADSLQKQADENLAKNASPKGKDALMVGQLKVAVKNGTASDTQKAALAAFQNQNPTDLQTKLNTQDAAQVTKLMTDRPVLTTLNQESRDVLSIVNQMPESDFGILAGRFTGKLSANGQRIQKFLAAIPFTLRSVLNIPASEMRAAQIQSQLNQASGSINTYKESLITIMNNFREMSAQKAGQDWKQESQIRQGGDQSNYQSWLKTNPDPSQQKESKTFIDPSVPLDSIHTDKNGTKAKYIGGDIKNPNSWMVIK